MTVYLLDSNVFIEAARRYYAFDLAPKFWEALLLNADLGQIRSIDRVKHELERGNDQLASWAREAFAEACASTDDTAVTRSFAEIMNWVQTQEQFSNAAKANFARGADGWLVAYARVHGCILVTHEVLDLNTRRQVPIPNVCLGFGVPFIDTFEMLRALGIRFV